MLVFCNCDIRFNKGSIEFSIGKVAGVGGFTIAALTLSPVRKLCACLFEKNPEKPQCHWPNMKGYSLPSNTNEIKALKS